MAIPDFVLELCRHVGHAPLWMSGTTVIILRPTPGQVAIDWKRPAAPEVVEILYACRSDNGAWTPVTNIVDPGEEPAIAAARETLEEADVRIEVRRLLFIEAVGPATYYNGDVITCLDVALATQWVGGEPSPTDGENDETTFFRGDQLPPTKDCFHRAVTKALGAHPGADFLTAWPRVSGGTRLYLVEVSAITLVFLLNPLRD